MVKLYDEAKVMEIHDYNVKQRGFEIGFKIGFEIGFKLGIEKSIPVVVRFVRKLSEPKEVAIKLLVDEFGLSPRAAEEKVQEYWEH